MRSSFPAFVPPAPRCRQGCGAESASRSPPSLVSANHSRGCVFEAPFGWVARLVLFGRLALSLDIERHRLTNQILQRRLIDLVPFVDVDGAPHIPPEA